MFATLNAADTLYGVAESATTVNITVFGAELPASSEDFDMLVHTQLSDTAGLLYTVPADTRTIVKTIHVVNTNAAATKTFQLFVNGSAASDAVTPEVTLPAGGWATFAADGWKVYQPTGELSLVGSTGPAGDTGPQGDPGNDGAPGATGATGPAPAGSVTLTAAGFWPRTTNGCAAAALVEMTTNKNNFYMLDFDGSTQEYAQIAFDMPSDWDGGSLTAEFVWTVNASVATQVVWGIQAVSYGDNEALDAAFSTAVEVTDTAQSGAHEKYTSPTTSSFTPAGTPAAGERVLFQVYRDPADANDTMSQDARLLGVILHFTRT